MAVDGIKHCFTVKYKKRKRDEITTERNKESFEAGQHKCNQQL
jgi:hypothetical protein